MRRNTGIVQVLGVTGIDVEKTLEVNETYNFVGIVGQSKLKEPYDSGYYVTLRSVNDIIGELTLDHEPVTETYPGIDTSFTANAKYADSVSLYYRNKGESTYKSIEMIGEGITYNAKILETEVSDEFQYYIEAKAGEEKKSAGTAEVPFNVKKVDKTTGPKISDFQPFGTIETPHPVISAKISDSYGVNTKSVNDFCGWNMILQQKLKFQTVTSC